MLENFIIVNIICAIAFIVTLKMLVKENEKIMDKIMEGEKDE